MGSAPSADLYWGFNLGDMTDSGYHSLKPAWMGGYDEDADEERDSRDWEEVYAERAGGWIEAPFPEHSVPDRSLIYAKYRGHGSAGFTAAEAEINRAEDALRETPEYRAWWASRSRMHKIVERSSCVISVYGYGPMWYVAIKASVQKADDYGDIELKPLVVADDWEWQLLDFMKLMDLTVPAGDKPTWHMCCSYG